jgi:FMN-dependent NADH-azoreductase
VNELKAYEPDHEVIRRDLGFDPVPHPSADYASALSTREAYLAALETNALDLSELLIKELEASDLIVIGTPMNNFAVPSCLKAWLDHVIRIGRTLGSGPDGKFGLLSDRPVYIAISSGDIFEGPGAKQPDFLTPYLTAALGCIGLKKISTFSIQNTARTEEEVLLQRLLQLQSTISSTVGGRTLSSAATG